MIIPTLDLRPALHPVRDQGRRPTCLAFALSAAHEHRTRSKGHLSVEYLYYHAVRRMPGADPAAGTHITAASAALAEDGQPIDRRWPYLDHQPAPAEWTPPVKPGRCYRSPSHSGATDIASIIAHLDAGHPVVLGLIITTCFLRCGPDGTLPALTPDPERGRHAVLAVGHGRAGTHLLVRNSWGTRWGAAGHAWLPAAYLNRYLRNTRLLTEVLS